jgi:hypothetical protein
MPKAAKGDEAANETEAAADAEAENENEAATTPTQASSPTTTRAKIEQRLQRAIDDAPPTKNRSPELVPLTAEYEKMRKNCTCTYFIPYEDSFQSMLYCNVLVEYRYCPRIYSQSDSPSFFLSFLALSM